jgi:hypothetical protein
MSAAPKFNVQVALKAKERVFVTYFLAVGQESIFGSAQIFSRLCNRPDHYSTHKTKMKNEKKPML